MNSHGATWNGKIKLVPEKLDEPLRLKKPRRIFVNSMSDLFHENVPDEFIDQVFAVMAMASQHTFQVLTKRPDRMHRYLNDADLQDRLTDLWHERSPENIRWSFMLPLTNVWLGVSVENQETADERIPLLLQTPATVRWISAEPLLGDISLRSWLQLSPSAAFVNGQVTDKMPSWTRYGSTALNWVVAGGESGPSARPMHPDWARSLRDQCQVAGTPFFFKQWGEWQIASNENGHIDSDMARNNAHWVAMDGSAHKPSSLGLDNPYAMVKAGKKTAGRLLDGRQWNEFPS